MNNFNRRSNLMNKPTIGQDCIGQDCICPDGLGRVREIVEWCAGYVGIRVTTSSTTHVWDSKNVILIPSGGIYKGRRI